MRIEVPHPRHFGTLVLRALRHVGTGRALHARMTPIVPTPPQPGLPVQPTQPTLPSEQPIHAPVNPDPKSHPIHPAIPTQPIHEGTDPSTPVTGDDRIR